MLTVFCENNTLIARDAAGNVRVSKPLSEFRGCGCADIASYLFAAEEIKEIGHLVTGETVIWLNEAPF